jgi:ribosomal protein S18 acetylase RimI-like enzyme
MTLRPATAADVPAVLPMVSAIAALHEGWDAAKYPYVPNVAERYRNWLGARAVDANSVFLVAERPAVNGEAAKLVAFLIATVEGELPIYRVKSYGFIHDLWVEPTYRNEGLGRQLTMLAIERFREMGVEQVRLDTAAANEAARGLFASCGFRVSTIEMLLELK